MTVRLANSTLREQIATELTTRIVTGDLATGTPLPSFRALAAQYQTSRRTINTAIRVLAEKKLIRPRRNRPALVAPGAGRTPTTHPCRIAILAPFDDAGFSFAESPWSWLLYRAVLVYALKRNWSCATLPRRTFQDHLKGLDALIAIAAGRAIHGRLLEIGLPFVNLLSGDNHGQPGALDLDRGPAMEQSAIYFLGHGVKKVLVLGSPHQTTYEKWRAEHFDALLANAGVESTHILLPAQKNVADNQAAAAGAMQTYLRPPPGAPLGVLCAYDPYAYGVIAVGTAAGLRLRKDLFVIGSADMDAYNHHSPTLTSQSCPYEKLGRRAVEMLARSINKRMVLPGEYFPSKLMIRET